MMRFVPQRFWRETPLMAVVAVVMLLIAGVTGALFAERDFRDQKMEQALAHARVLAASVSASLAFQDVNDAQQAVDALSANPDIGAVGVYAGDGSFFAGRSGPGGAPPSNFAAVAPVAYADGFATASAAVEQGNVQLGYVYVRLSSGAGASRWVRYIGIALLLLMSMILLAVIAYAQRALRVANAELSLRADELAASNAQLSAEISERRKAQTALAQAQKMEAVGQLTGGIAHDFNNLLMVISSGLRLLETRADEDKRAGIVTAMRQAVDRGAGLTKQLLAFSRRQKLTPEVVLVQERLENLGPLLERSLREDIKLVFDFVGPDAAVKIDPGQFDIAVLNLAVNARDAMPSGGKLTVRVSEPLTEPDVIAITVVDTGAGMTPEILARAFDPFFTTKEVGKGTGLGLSQVYGFAAQSGGRAELDSEPNVGTSVTLILPLTDEPAPPRQQKIVDEIAGAGHVLVVEDDESVAAMVCEMISDLGYTALRAADANDALAKLEGGAPVDLLFSDIIMPGKLSGIDLAREVHRRRPELPILLTTGYGGRDELDTHGFPILRKPYDRDELSAALARVSSSASAK